MRTTWEDGPDPDADEGWCDATCRPAGDHGGDLDRGLILDDGREPSSRHNANSAGTLYQDVVSTPGQTMTWTLQHRDRGGDDVMRVLIGDATSADVNSDTGWDYFSPDLTDGIAAWGSHTDQYVVPAGQTCTRFAFRAISAASGNDSIGNFLGAVGFAIAVPPTPTPRPNVTPPATTTEAPQATPRRDVPPPVLVLLASLAGLWAGSWLLLRRIDRRN